MSKFLFSVWFSILFQFAVAQTNPFESLPVPVLKERLQRGLPDTTRVQILLTLSRAMLFKSPDKNKVRSAIEYMQQAGALSKNTGYLRGQGNTLLMAALIDNFLGKRDKGLIDSQQALDLFIKSNDNRGIAESYIIIGQHYRDYSSESAEKIKYYKLAADMFKKTGLKLRAASTLQDIGDLLQEADKVREALLTLHDALTIYRTTDYKELQGLYDLIGYCSYRNNDYVTGIKYALLAVKTAEARKDTTLSLCTIYFRTGLEYYALKDFSQSNFYFQKSIKIAYKYRDSTSMAIVGVRLAENLAILHKYDQAIHLIQFISNIENEKDIEGQSEIQQNLAFIYLQAKQYANLDRCVQKIMKLSKLMRPDDDYYQQASRDIIINYFIMTGKYAECYPYLQISDKVHKRNNEQKSLATNEYKWYQVDSALGNFNTAMNHYRKSRAISDSLFNETKSRQIASLQIDNETEKKDQDIKLQARNIELLNQEAQLNKNRLQQTQTSRNVLIGGAGLMLIILGMGYNRYRLKQRNNLLLQSQQKEINDQNNSLQSLLTEKNNLITDKDQLIAEKDLLLKEVHHRVKNNLQIVMSLLESQSSFLSNNAAITAILESQNRVQTIALIHQKLYSSNNVVEVNMQAYIPELITYLADSFDTKTRGISVEHSIASVKLDVSQAIPVGIILNETITNAIKYAFPGSNPGKIKVMVKHNEFDRVFLQVGDNGIGLPPGFDIHKNNSLGMTLIRGLSNQLEGDFKIKNENGVKITIEFTIDHSINLHRYQIINDQLES